MITYINKLLSISPHISAALARSAGVGYSLMSHKSKNNNNRR